MDEEFRLSKKEVRLVQIEKGMVFFIYNYRSNVIKGKVRLGEYLYLKEGSPYLYTHGVEQYKRFKIVRKYRFMERVRFILKSGFNFKKLFQAIFSNMVDIECIN
jgi:hypothetical protein